MTKIQYAISKKGDAFFSALSKSVDAYLKTLPNGRYANALLWMKAILFISLFWGAYLLILFGDLPGWGIILLYASLGVSGLLVAFNVSHDAAHHALSSNRAVNKWLYYFTFNTLGTNAYLWELRHINSHHLFPNVDNCDADIDSNFIIRLSPNRPLLPHHRWQHIYGPILYSIYTLQWVFYKDWHYLGRKNLANLRDMHHPVSEVAGFLVAKVLYFTYLILVPVFVIGIPWDTVLLGFLAFHVVLSYFFILTNILNHHVEEADFPGLSEDGHLPYNWAEHQIATCLDYRPTSKWLNFFFGGFNSHCAHHLFPSVCHVHYVPITRMIIQAAAEYGIEHKQTTWWEALKSHFRHLKELGRQPPKA